MSVKLGDQAPEFSLPQIDGKLISLSDFQNQWVILYFYPKDNTSGCTAQACQFRDLFPKFQALHVPILGISRDSLKSHHNFQEKYQLPFILLSDEDGKVCQSYEVWVEKSLYGRKYFGISRSTFLINPQGIIAEAWQKVKVPGHGQEVLKKLQMLKND